MTLDQMLYTFWWIMSSVFKLAGLWAAPIVVILLLVRTFKMEVKMRKKTMSKYFNDWGSDEDILHYGVKGMKWRKGRKRYFTKDSKGVKKRGVEMRTPFGVISGSGINMAKYYDTHGGLTYILDRNKKLQYERPEQKNIPKLKSNWKKRLKAKIQNYQDQEYKKRLEEAMEKERRKRK